jgi:hypothetical protein
MLTFDKARKVFLSYPELNEKRDAYYRYYYDFIGSKQRGKNVIGEFRGNLNGSCNGYVHARYMPDTVRNKYRSELDDRLMINFRTYSTDKLRELIDDALKVMK